jgi:Cytochrome c7 and related cytochrome c
MSVLALAAAGCRLFETTTPAAPPGPLLPGQTAGVFTTTRPTMGAVVNDFLSRTPTPEQPIEFPHNVHVAKKIACTDYCHESVTTGPVAGLPSVRTCMICHDAIATDRPRIRQITAMRAQGIDLAWQRVYGYPAASHVKFNHAPHIRAKLECATCHGNIAEQTVAQRNVEMTMGYCVNCHTARKVSTDCLTCHF